MLLKGKLQESVHGGLKPLRVLKQVLRCFVDFCLSIEKVSSIYLYQAFFSFFVILISFFRALKKEFAYQKKEGF